MENYFIQLLKIIFGELKKLESYEKKEVFYINGEKYEIFGCKKQDHYFVWCNKLEKIIIETDEKIAFENMTKYIINKIVWKK